MLKQVITSKLKNVAVYSLTCHLTIRFNLLNILTEQDIDMVKHKNTIINKWDAKEESDFLPRFQQNTDNRYRIGQSLDNMTQ